MTTDDQVTEKEFHRALTCFHAEERPLWPLFHAEVHTHMAAAARAAALRVTLISDTI